VRTLIRLGSLRYHGVQAQLYVRAGLSKNKSVAHTGRVTGVSAKWFAGSPEFANWTNSDLFTEMQKLALERKAVGNDADVQADSFSALLKQMLHYLPGPCDVLGVP
jgi:hypothetical protein